MKEDVIISCIIPVYNSERYLFDTLNSLLQQTFKKFEIICVNDASKDNSLKILEQFKQKDSRFQIINNAENQGAAICRNKGLDFASGEYVIFLDSDDFFYEDMLEKSYHIAQLYHSDLVIFGIERVKLKNNNSETGLKTDVVNRFQIVEKGRRDKEYVRMIGNGAINKLIKKDMLEHYDITFQNIESNNDLFFSMAVGLAADKAVICDRVLMRYYMGRDGSITQFRRTKKNCRVLAFAHLLEFLEKIEIEKDLENELYNYMIYLLECDFESTDNSIECKANIEKQLYDSHYFRQKIKQAYEEGRLYSHARVFAHKLLQREKIKECRFYEYYIPAIKKSIDNHKKNGKKVALWGCGIIGKQIIDGANINGIVFDYVIDMDEKKQNTAYGGYMINKYEAIKDDIDTVLISVFKLRYRDEIMELLKGKEIINIYTM